MIKGISEKRRLRRIGKVRLGMKTKNAAGKEYPTALEHFNFEDAPGLEELFGKNCKEFEIMLPNENVDAFFPQERKCYRTSGLFCRGDGETATRVNVGLVEGKPLDPDGMAFIKEQGLRVDTGDMFDMPCLGEECPFTVKKLCKPIGRFLFLVPSAPHIGVYEISTTSINSIIELNSYIDTVRVVAGRVSMIPLKLKLVPKETKIPKSTTKKTIHHLVLEFAGSFDSLAKYRNLKQIPLDQLPTRHELEQHVPEDLMPHGGAALDAELVGPIADPVEEDPNKPLDPVKITPGVVTKKAGEFCIPDGANKYFSAEESMAVKAKAIHGKAGSFMAMIEIREGRKFIVSIDS